jgi:hypothetical protein
MARYISKFSIFLSSQICETAGRYEEQKFIALSSTGSVRAHTKKLRSGHWLLDELNITFYVSGVVDVPRMRIDRCIK